jgi:hypothetical protein
MHPLAWETVMAKQTATEFLSEESWVEIHALAG